MRRASELFLALRERADGDTLQQWLYEALCQAMRDGRLPPGSRLPASRNLARDHGLSRSTVSFVFERLLAEGYISAHVGRGSFVSVTLPQFPPAMTAAHAPLALSRRGRDMARAGAFVQGGDPLVRTFEADRIDPALLPAHTWAQLCGRRSLWHEARLTSNLAAEGYAPLREVLAEQLALTRGIRCTAAQIVMVASARQAVDLLARLLLNPGDEVWLEDPGAPDLQALLAAAGARVVPVPADEHGLQVDAGLRAAPRARLACTTAAAQMPLGRPLSAARRTALLDWASATHAYVLEDDRDGDFVWDAPATDALKCHDTQDGVIHVGSFAYSVSPALRLAYLVLPQRLVEPVCAALALTGSAPSAFDQAVLFDFIAMGHWARHLRQAREVYAGRAHALRFNLDKYFGRWLQLQPLQRGLSLTVRLPAAVRDTDVAARAAAAGVAVTPLSAHRLHHPAPAGLRLGFAAFSEPSIQLGVQKLAAALHPA